MQESHLTLVVAGEAAVLVYFADNASQDVLGDIQAFNTKLKALRMPWLVDSIPSFTSLLIEYNPMLIDYRAVSDEIHKLSGQLNELGNIHASSSKPIVALPTYYAEEVGLDLHNIAKLTSLRVEQVIKVHSDVVYQVYAVGFAPGFTYLGALDKSLILPRLKTPRLKVPKGSVAIAENQTAIYPNESPGGWHILGNCPIPLFDKNDDVPMNISVGDKVRFVPVSQSEFLKLGGVIS